MAYPQRLLERERAEFTAPLAGLLMAGDMVVVTV
jgi:hypothetical protein